MRIKVIEGKGKKDRYINMSAHILEALEDYYHQYKPQIFLFNGMQAGKQYSSRSVQQILEAALIKTKLFS